MTFEQMKIFLEAAHFGSFTHAAERLGLTQSAVSVSIKKLEEKHDVSLFDRSGRRLMLTEAGQVALRDDVLNHLGTMPFRPGAPISRSLWLIFICPWGVRTHAVMPLDDELGLPESDNIASLCGLVALCMEGYSRLKSVM